jgi:anti-sigma factor RsiW
MHLDDELLQRLIDRELSPEAADPVRGHLETCAACRDRVARAGREEVEIGRLLQLLDHPAPPVTPDRIAARVRPRRLRGIRWAAMLLLAAGLAGVAYAAPGSPLRAWITSLRQPTEAPLGPSVPAGEPPRSQDSGLAGIAVPPGTRLVLQFASRQEAGAAVVTLAATATEVTVRAPAGAATFVAGPDSLLIDNRGAGAGYAIEIPADAPRVEIRLAGTRIFLKDGATVMTPDGRVAGPGPFRLRLGP